MNIEMVVDGRSLVKIDVNLATLVLALRESVKKEERGGAESTPANKSQMRELLSRIDQKSVAFLRRIAASEDGSITWTQMREVFAIKQADDWSAYSGSFGKGMTRAYRNILGDRSARLVSWNEADWTEYDWDSDMCNVYVDGPALVALRAAIKD